MGLIWTIAMIHFFGAILSSILMAATLVDPGPITLIFLALSISCFVGGALFLAINMIIELLTEIRNATRDLTPEAVARREAGAKMDKYL